MKVNGLLFYIIKKTGKAIWDYNMIKEGDRILVAVSGGKDSLCLLTVLKERTKFVPIHFEILACFVDMGFPWVEKEKLFEFFKERSFPYVIARPPKEWDIKKEFNCFFCSWNRRKALFNIAKELGFNKIALAHHMDDIVETMLLNLFFQGEISTMKPYQEMFGGQITIIRPFAYVEEKDLIRLSKRLNLPVCASSCPKSLQSKRKMVKEIIAEIGKITPTVKKNIFRSLKRVREKYLL